MNDKQVKVGEVILNIEECYPYRHDYGNGKEVLRIKILESEHDFNSLKILENNENSIEYIEDRVIKNVYKGYILDFNCQYSSGEYSVEITRITQQERMMKELREELTLTQNALDSLIMK